MEDALIKVEISRQIALGQWEVARALTIVYWSSAYDKSSAETWIAELLLAITTHPEKYCVGSLTIRTLYHLSWLALELLKELKIDKPEVPLLRKATTFKLYIWKASKICSDIPYQDLSTFFETHNLDDSNNNNVVNVPQSIVDFLYRLKSEDSRLSCYIQRCLLEHPKFEEVSENLNLTWMRDKCRELKELSVKDENNSTQRSSIGQLLLNEFRTHIFASYDEDSKVFKSCIIPEDICEDLLSFCKLGIFTKAEVYEALLCNLYTAEKFCETEDRLLGRMGITDELELAQNFLSSVFQSDGYVNIRELGLRCLRNSDHFLEMIFNCLMVLAKRRVYKETTKYLEYHLTRRMRPLILLSMWANVETCDDAMELLTHLWPANLDKEVYEIVFVKACDKLSHEAEVAQWCLQLRRLNPTAAIGPERTFNELCVDLKSHSVLHVLNRNFHISKVEQADIQEILEKCTTSITPCSKREKSVRFACENDVDERKVYQSIDCKIFQSYCIMNSALEAVQFCADHELWLRENKRRRTLDEVTQTTDDEESFGQTENWDALYKDKVTTNLDKIENLLPSLYPLAYRLKILENLFSLIFANRSDLNSDDDASDVDEGSDTSWEKTENENETMVDEKNDDANPEEKRLTSEEEDEQHSNNEKRNRASNDVTSSISTCSSASSSSFSNCEFLCDDVIILKLLMIIKDNLLDISLKFERRKQFPAIVFWNEDGDCNVLREKRFQQSVTNLKKHVTEAIWRFEIVTANDACGQGIQNVRVQPCYDYLQLPRDKHVKQMRAASGSQSSGGKTKNKRRSRCHLHASYVGGCHNLKCYHRTTNKMLASKESLLNMCLLQMDPVKAGQVINTFQMQDTTAAAEIVFSEKYAIIAEEFQSTTAPNPQCLIPAEPLSQEDDTSFAFSLREIASTAAAGLNATLDESRVDDFLSRCIVPSVPGMQEALKNPTSPFWKELGECQDLNALVLCDLAFTSCQTLESSSSLLQAALNRISAIVSTNKPIVSANNDVKGLAKFVEQMMNLIAEVTHKQNSSLSLFSSTNFSKQNNVSDVLTQGLLPLEAKRYALAVDAYNARDICLQNYLTAKESFERNKNLFVENENREKMSVHEAFIRLVHCCSSQLKHRIENLNRASDSNMQYPDFLRTLYIYLRKLATLQAHHNPDQKDASSNNSFLNVLDEGLTQSLIKMISEDDVVIDWVKKFTNHAGIDLRHIITQACVGIIPSRGYLPVQYEGHKITKFGQYILNSSPRANETQSMHPGIVASELLTSLIQFLKENCTMVDGVLSEAELQKNISNPVLQNLLETTGELASVDLNMLSTHNECVAFLVNVTNLLALHAVILRIYSKDLVKFGPSRYLAESCQVAYYVGQFNVISLFELQCLIRGKRTTGLQIPMEILEQRKGALQGKLLLCKPKVVFLVIFCNLSSPKLQVVLPDTVENQMDDALVEYLNCHVSVNLDEKEITVPELLAQCPVDNENPQDVLGIVNSHFNGINAEALSEYIDGTDALDLKINVKPFNFQPAVVISYPNKGFQNLPIDQPAVRMEIEIKNIPDHVREYLRSNCWMASYMIDVLAGSPANDERCERLNLLIKQFDDILPVDVLIPAYHEVNFWVDLDRLLIEQDWKSILEFMEISSTVRLEMRTTISPMFDFILCHLIDENNPDYILPQKMTSDELQAHCVLALYKKWNFAECRASLLTAGTRYSLRPELKDKLIRTWKCLEIYHEITELLTEQGFNEDWQTVAGWGVEKCEEFLLFLLSKRNYKLAIKWINLHEIPPNLHKLSEVMKLMLDLDQEPPNTTNALILLEQMTDRALAVEVCEDVVKSLDSLVGQTFMLEYLLNDLDEHLTEDKKQGLHLMHMGVKILTCLPPSERKDYVAIASQPHIMIEQLIMNTKIELLEKSLIAIKDDIIALNSDVLSSEGEIKTLLKTYAQKALEVQIVRGNLSLAQPYDGLSRGGRKKSETFTMPIGPPKKEDWMPDELVAVCPVCHTETFNMFNRRHHCRRCGRVVCAACSQHRGYVQGYDDVKVRICNNCKGGECMMSSMIFSTPTGTSFDKRIWSPSGSRAPDVAYSRSPSISSIASSNFPQTTSKVEETNVWQLNLNENHNTTVREEFSYDLTPNVSLCLSLLSCFLEPTEAAKCILELCESLFTVLQPIDNKGVLNPEVNHNMIMSVIETLIVHAKLKFSDESNQLGMMKCDISLNNLNLVKLLITDNCYHLIPRHGISNQDGIRRLRDQLLEEERWTLALEVTAKNRLEVAGVWVAWGLALLKSNDFQAARDKFIHCVEKFVDKNQTSPAEGFLLEIIKQLEKHLYNPPGGVISIKEMLASLQAISKKGGTAICLPQKHGDKINKMVFDECMYYLHTYGTHMAVVSFLVKHNKIDTALKYILENSCETEIFVVGLCIPSIHKNKLADVETQLIRNDPSLLLWSRYLNALGSYLSRNHFHHMLYRLQLFCKDYNRAAITCLTLFGDAGSDYDRLWGKLHHLENAREHLMTALHQTELTPRHRGPTWKTKEESTLRPLLSVKEIQKYINKIDLQMEITKYFKENPCDLLSLLEETSEQSPSQQSSKTNFVPMAFDNTLATTQLAAMIILAGSSIESGFALAYKLIQQSKLDPVRVFSLTGRQLAKRHRFADIHLLVSAIKNSGDCKPDTINEVVMPCVLVLVREPGENTEADNLIKLLTSDELKIHAYILCGKLKKAYFLAVNERNISAVQKILSIAEHSGQKNMKQICTRWLASQEKK